MTTRIRITNEGPHRAVIGSPTERHFIAAGESVTMQMGDKHPVVCTEYEVDANELGALILPADFKQ